MKSICMLFGLIVFLLPLSAQKELNPLTSNLNLSKSNINRLVFPVSLITTSNGILLLKDLEKANLPDQAGMKSWLAANFKRYGVDPDKIKQIFVFPMRQYEDCTICKKYCKGRCVQDPGADCVCIHHSDPNLKYADPVNAGVMPSLKTTDPGKTGFIIYLSLSATDEDQAIEAVAGVLNAQKQGAKTD